MPNLVCSVRIYEVPCRLRKLGMTELCRAVRQSCQNLLLLARLSTEPASLLRLRFFRRSRRFGGFLFLRSRLLFFRRHRF
jgi:hypothetical protein